MFTRLVGHPSGPAKKIAPVAAGDAPRLPEWCPWRPGRTTKEMGNHHEFPLLSSRKIRIEPRNWVNLVTNWLIWGLVQTLEFHMKPTQMEMAGWGPPVYHAPRWRFPMGKPPFSSSHPLKKMRFSHGNHQKKAGGISMEPPHETLWGFHGGKSHLSEKCPFIDGIFHEIFQLAPSRFSLRDLRLREGRGASETT